MRCALSRKTVDASIQRVSITPTSNELPPTFSVLSVSQQLRIERYRGLPASARRAETNNVQASWRQRNNRELNDRWAASRASHKHTGRHSTVRTHDGMETQQRALLHISSRSLAFDKSHVQYLCHPDARAQRRWITSQSNSSSRSATKPVQPRFIPVIPPKPHDSSRGQSKPAIPVSISRANVAGRPSGSSGSRDCDGEDDGEVMLASVKVSDERRRLKARDTSARVQRWYNLYRKLISDGNSCLAISKDLNLNHVKDELSKATLLGKLGYRLRYHPRCHHKLDKNAKVLDAIQLELLNLGDAIVRQASERCVQTYIQTKLVPLERQLRRVENACRDALAKYFYDSNGSDIVSGANAIVQATDEYKAFNSKEAEIWKGISVIGYLLRDIHLSLHRMRATHPNLNFAVSRKLDAACDAATRTTMGSFGSVSDSKDSGMSLLGGTAHRVREIGLDIRLRKAVPEITFATRWAHLTKACYVSPIRRDIETIRTVLELCVIKGNTRCIRRTRTPARWRQFEILRFLAVKCCVMAGSILDSFSNIIGNGFSSICPHPNPNLHRMQTRTFGVIEQVDRSWDDLLSHMTVVSKYTNEVCEGWKDALPIQDLRIRRDICDAIDVFFLSSSLGGVTALSRRRTRQVNQNLLVWYSARLLWEGIKTTNAHDSVPSSDKLANCGQNSSIRASSSSSSSSSSRLPQQTLPVPSWIHKESLYPDASSVMIDFVITPPTLQQVVTEILQHSIIGVDVFLPEQRIGHYFSHYVVLATKTNVYILDTRALNYEGQYLRWAMKRIFLDESILKVSISSRASNSALWDHFGIDIQNGCDAVPHSSTNESAKPASLDSLLRTIYKGSYNFDDTRTRVFASQFTDPTTFFQYLALRAYAPLMVFHALRQPLSEELLSLPIPDTDSNLLGVSLESDSKFTLGPVNIDRMEQYFTRAMAQSLARKETWQGSRNDWMYSISLAAARDTLRKCGLNISSRASRQRLKNKADEAIELKVAAYYLATTFGETLAAIEKCLSMTNPARWILWASDRLKLRLNDVDREKYQKAAEIYASEPQTKVISLPRRRIARISFPLPDVQKSGDDPMVTMVEQDEIDEGESIDDESPWSSPFFASPPIVENESGGTPRFTTVPMITSGMKNSKPLKPRRSTHRQRRGAKTASKTSTDRDVISDKETNEQITLRKIGSDTMRMAKQAKRKSKAKKTSDLQDAQAKASIQAEDRSALDQSNEGILAQLSAFFSRGAKPEEGHQKESSSEQQPTPSQNELSTTEEAKLFKKSARYQEKRARRQRENRRRESAVEKAKSKAAREGQK